MSTSSSEQNPGGVSQSQTGTVRLWQDRCLWMLVLTALLLGGRAWSNGVTHQGLPEASFWRAKLEPAAQADVVFAGDSRTYRGIVPEVIASQVGASKILNFGFSGVALDEAYLSAAEAMCQPDASDRVIVLGVTPHSLTPRAAAANGFVDHARCLGREVTGFSVLLDEVESRFPAYAFADLLVDLRQVLSGSRSRGLMPRRVPLTFYHRDGWAESLLQGVDSTRTSRTVEHYQRLFEDNVVSDEQIQRLLRTVEDWTRQGIRVMAFFPPVSRQLLEIERGACRCRMQDIRHQLEQTGVHWLEIDDGQLECYDGSHLDGGSARLFSQRLGQAVHQVMASRSAETATDQGL